MATSQEILEALADYKVQCNGNARLRRMQRDWSRLLHFHAEDTDDWFTMKVVQGRSSPLPLEPRVPRTSWSPR